MAEWRGLGSDLLCEHASCWILRRGQAGSGGRCLFAAAPVFASRRQRNAYVELCDAIGSNPDRERLHHGTSLLVCREHLRTHISEARGKILGETAPERRAHCREFFINKRDAPIFTHAEAVAVGDAQKYAPIFSQYTDSAAGPPALGDIAMPNLEDYRRCFPGKFFGKARTAEAGLPSAPPPWETRRACAVFRGGATGGGVCPATNPRLRLAWLSRIWAEDDRRDGGTPLLDAKLTSWNQRQKVGRDGVVRVLDPEELRTSWGLTDVGRHHYLGWAEQATFKYAVYLDGNVGAGRLGAMLGLGFVILAPPSEKPATQLRMHMKAFVHFLPLRADMEDLREALLWLRENDDEARRLSDSARALHRQHCTKDAIEREMRWLVRGLPPPDDVAFQVTLEHIWTRARAGVYVLLDERGKLRIFAPFANEDFVIKRNEGAAAAELPTESGTTQDFLERVLRLTGEVVTLPPERWWRNGSLVCNVMPADVWGESMLAEMRLLIERAGRD